MARPTVELVLRELPLIGRTGTVELRVTVDRATPIEFIDVRLEGRQGWSVGGGKSRVSVEIEVPKLEVRLMGAGELPAATTSTFVFAFDLPATAAPSHDLTPAHAELWMRLHISIPWRLDGRYTFHLPARLPPPAKVERTPVIVRSAPVTSAPDGPRLELSLASNRLVVGETAVGSLALFHTDDRKPREVTLTFVPLLDLYGRGSPGGREGQGLSTRIAIPAGAAGSAVPFRIELPSTMVPSFETTTHRLRWQLVATTGSLFTAKLEARCGLVLVDAAAAAIAAPLERPPRIGEAWIETLFAVVAADLGWRTVPADHDRDHGPALTGDLADGAAELRYDYRGQDGTFLVTRVAHEPLGLGLTVTPGSALRHLLWTDVEIDLPAWDRAHYVAARFAEQAVPFLRAVVPALMQAAELGTMIRWDDDAMVFERPVVTVGEGELRAMIKRVRAVAAVVASARRDLARPPEPVLDLPAWRDLATWLDASMCPGDLALAGHLDGLPATVDFVWRDHRPVAVRASLGGPDVSADLHAISLRLAQPLADVLHVRVSDAVLDCVARWPPDLVDLVVEGGVASASLPLAQTDPRAIDVTRVRALVTSLRALIAALGPTTSPYRS
jgi:hypothetical protein